MRAQHTKIQHMRTGITFILIGVALFNHNQADAQRFNCRTIVVDDEPQRRDEIDAYIDVTDSTFSVWDDVGHVNFAIELDTLEDEMIVAKAKDYNVLVVFFPEKSVFIFQQRSRDGKIRELIYHNRTRY